MFTLSPRKSVDGYGNKDKHLEVTKLGIKCFQPFLQHVSVIDGQM